MNRIHSVKGLLGALIVIAALIVSNVIQASEACKTIHITGGRGLALNEVVLKPEILSVKKGSCVAWTNHGGVGNVRVGFKAEKNCEGFMTPLSEFKLDSDSGCFVADPLAPGKTASLTLDAEGIYDYVIEYLFTPTARVSGKIIVNK